MPGTFQQTIDKTIEGCKNYFAFIDDNFRATKGKIKDPDEALDIILQSLDKEGLSIKIQKCEFVNQTIERLGFKITPHGFKLLINKTEASQEIVVPKTLKQLRSFMGSIHHLKNFKPNSAKVSEILRTFFLKKTQPPPTC